MTEIRHALCRQDRETLRMNQTIGVLVLMTAVGSIVLPAVAQQPEASAQQTTESSSQHLSPAALQQIIAPIALYPDDLLSVVLPASTEPLQLVEAQRFLARHTANPSAKPPASWDPSVIALLNYPDVVEMMNKDLDWTQQLGSAMIDQQVDVLSAIQDFRKKAYDAGNLKSDPKQTVRVEHQSIVVQSADPQVIYVPRYDPQVVVAPVPAGAPPAYVYSPPYPHYASPAATFATGAIVGATVGFAIGWSSHAVYNGNWGWSGGNNVNVNRNVNVNNVQRAEFNNRVTANRENAWHPNRNTTARQQNALAARGGAGRVTSGSVRSGLAGRPNGGAPGFAGRPNGGTAGHSFGGARPAQGANRQAAFANRSPSQGAGHAARFGGAGQGGVRPSFQQRPGGAFAGISSGAQANRFSNRGGASLGSANRFAGGGRFGGGGGFGGGRFGGGGHGFRR